MLKDAFKVRIILCYLSDAFYVDRRRDRANITVQYTHGIPRYGNKFCSQRPLGSRIVKRSRKQRITRYFHHKIEDLDNRPADPLVNIDNHLEQLNINVREQPHSFDVWKELIDYLGGKNLNKKMSIVIRQL